MIKRRKKIVNSTFSKSEASISVKGKNSIKNKKNQIIDYSIISNIGKPMGNLCVFVLNTGSTILFDLHIEMLFKNLLSVFHIIVLTCKKNVCMCVRERENERSGERKSKNLFWYFMLLVSSKALLYI